ncbi:hypothetical protein ACH5RR_039663 [Cinchona calisaya]|uniref:Uncharacterized protein n=1 Tax=Cinchona calisaya TaxID=153742 RepID=A0ABD2Y1J4_9GENT
MKQQVTALESLEGEADHSGMIIDYVLNSIHNQQGANSTLKFPGLTFLIKAMIMIVSLTSSTKMTSSLK